MRVCMIGTGYVGLVTGVCLAETGNDVWCVDIDETKIARLNEGELPIYEPGLEEVLRRNLKQGRLHFTTSLEHGIQSSLFVFIAVGTPPGEDGRADLQHVLAVAEQIGACLDSYKILVLKSTVPVGTTLRMKTIVEEALQRRGRRDIEFDVAFCPEFLKEGSAVEDFLHPDRVVVGTENGRTAEFLKELFAPFILRENSLFAMSIPSAELTKYAANAMLATRISFMNELAAFCETVGADIEEIRVGIGSDSRIGHAFLQAGLGYGGSCFPKDVKALIHSAREKEYDLSILRAVEEVNRRQRQVFLDRMECHYGGKENLAGKTFALWGLSFKPNTDDIREAPSLFLVRELRRLGASIRAYDPVAEANARALLGDDPGIVYVEDCYDALSGADALLLVTEWPLFRHPDFDRMKSLLREAVIFDGRNLYAPDRARAMGFVCYGIGRGGV
ncbi:UDP-glucose/GDP-mannose dehydrogenase family protein [Aminiphilus sp.]|jgi:UDPglucose 6-dehydrogenase|uniref:UDP-glucose dehydrogenase family protein n=1 Tax=Aminiphilus sp. TaxID=1872488 RepID=UPI002618A54C|nr:UDP-glucose/GDP-mannose dehydrogenase family protein [Aminiphilus sp.]